MRIIIPDEVVDFKNPVVTIGTFDGVHVGHAAVIQSVLSYAQTHQGMSVVLTFDPHPRQFIDGANAPSLLTTLPEKSARFEALGLDVLVVVPFDENLRQLAPDAFVGRYLVDWMHASHVVVGYDHGFGKNRQGGYDTMRALGTRFGFGVTSVEPSVVNDSPISSTRIRRALEANLFGEAAALLGGHYPVWGVVIPGEGRGKNLGFPTANVSFNMAEKLSPPPGVYAAWVQFEEPLPAVVNFGQRPTFDGENWTFEVHILNFSGDLYGQTLKVELAYHIRAERKFENKDALIAQVQKDIQIAKQLLSQSNSQ
jgi:riboflavin kinase/FMN adenylyltransferase